MFIPVILSSFTDVYTIDQMVHEATIKYMLPIDYKRLLLRIVYPRYNLEKITWLCEILSREPRITALHLETIPDEDECTLLPFLLSHLPPHIHTILFSSISIPMSKVISLFHTILQSKPNIPRHYWFRLEKSPPADQLHLASFLMLPTITKRLRTHESTHMKWDSSSGQVILPSLQGYGLIHSTVEKHLHLTLLRRILILVHIHYLPRYLLQQVMYYML